MPENASTEFIAEPFADGFGTESPKPCPIRDGKVLLLVRCLRRHGFRIRALVAHILPLSRFLFAFHTDNSVRAFCIVSRQVPGGFGRRRPVDLRFRRDHEFNL